MTESLFIGQRLGKSQMLLVPSFNGKGSRLLGILTLLAFSLLIGLPNIPKGGDAKKRSGTIPQAFPVDLF